MDKIKNGKYLKYGALSALLTFAMGIIIFTCRNRLFGDYTFMHCDLIAQYNCVAKLFIKQLFVNHNIIYSWNASMGCNTLPLYSFYSCFSPFTLIYAFDIDADVASFIVTFGKLSLAAFAFNWFLQKYIKVSSKLSVAFAISYALNGFAMAYYPNLIWFDGLYMLPIIIALVIDFVNEKKNYCLLIIAYAYIFVVNFYSGYIVGLFSAFIFLLLLLRNNMITIKRKVKIIGIYVLAVVSAALVSAPLLFPTAMALLNQRAEDGSSFMGLHLNVMDIFLQLFIGQVSAGETGYFPYVYCGLFALLLLFLYFLNKKIQKKDKIIAGFVIVAFVVCSLVGPFYLALHCFDVPDNLNFRYAYLVVFVLLCLAADGLNNITTINKKIIFSVSSMCCLLFLFYSVIQTRIYEFVFKLNLLFVIINIVFLILYAFLISRYAENKKKNFCEICCILLIIAELCVNGLAYERINGKVLFEDADLYSFYSEQISAVSEELASKDSSFYRVHLPYHLYCNDSMKYGYKSIGMYSSYQIKDLRKTLGKLGYVSYALLTDDIGSTEITRMLMGDKYNIFYSEFAEVQNEVYYKENDYWLPVGYMVSNNVIDLSLNEESNPFVNQNRLLSSLIGEDVEFFYNTGANVTIDCYNCRMMEDNEYPTYLLIDETQKGCVLFSDSSMETRYAYFSMPYIMNAVDSPSLSNSDILKGTLIFDSNLFSPHIVETSNEDSDIYIIMGGARLGFSMFEKAYFYGVHSDQMHYIYQKLSDSVYEVELYRDGYIKGKVDVKKEGFDVLFTSIPYEDGWKIYVDGRETEKLALVDGAFLGAKVGQGEHEIVMKYYDNNITIGFAMFFVGIIIFGMFVYAFIKSTKVAKGYDIKK